MTVLITGATGSVGLETIRALSPDVPARAAARNPERAAATERLLGRPPITFRQFAPDHPHVWR